MAVCLQNRYNATVQHVRGLLDAGELGAVLGGAATVVWHRTPEYYAAKPWRGQRRRSGGGVLINQAIHTLDLLQWLVGDVASVEGHCGTYALAGVVDVEDTASIVLDHASGARSVFFATNANVVDSPVTVDLVTERARVSIRGDLTITWDDGRVDVVPERRSTSVGRDYWGVSHELLIADAYRTRGTGERFWIGPAEAFPAQRILAEVYALSGRLIVTAIVLSRHRPVERWEPLVLRYEIVLDACASLVQRMPVAVGRARRRRPGRRAGFAREQSRAVGVRRTSWSRCCRASRRCSVDLPVSVSRADGTGPRSG